MEQFERLVGLLLVNKFHISAAESCTGGLFSAHIVDIPNASEVLGASFVTYSEYAKCRLVGVYPETIAAYGVVSEEVAAEMAEGAAKAGNAEVGIGITGYAGPSGGTEKMPTGTVCFGYYLNGSLSSETVEYGAIGRNTVRDRAAVHAAEKLSELLISEK